MNKDLATLVNLQTLDMKIYDLEQSKKEFPLEVEKLKKIVSTAEEQLAKLTQKVEEIIEKKKNAEDEIKNAKDSLDKSEERLSSITTNREYDAVHTEIESNKQIIANGDANIKKLSDEIEKLEAAQKEAQEKLESIKNENQPTIDDLMSRISSIDTDIEKVLKEREEVVKTAYPPFLRTYEHLLKRKKNARIIGMVDNIEKTCSICHKVLEPQLVNEVRKSLQLNMCESCGSILIWTEGENDDFVRQPATEPKENEVVASGFAGDDTK